MAAQKELQMVVQMVMTRVAERVGWKVTRMVHWMVVMWEFVKVDSMGQNSDVTMAES